MEMRVEQLSVRSGVAVDTVRYYQSKGLLDPPRREGRVAWYDASHLERLGRIRSLQQRGFTLATIARLLSGELDAADEALVGELSGVRDPATPSGGPPAADGVASADARSGDADVGPVFTLSELADRTGVPLALLKAVEAEGLLVPRRVGGRERYTTEDVAASKAGLLLLESGIPLSALLDLARRHHEATEEVARQAVTLFSTHVRAPLRSEVRSSAHDAPSEDEQVHRLLQAYAELLPAVNTLVGHHFARTLVKAALDHVEQVGSDQERRAVQDQLDSVGAAGGDRSVLPASAGS
ncbi:MAG: MerR family transcriptional regulator [Acidimicrobiales bacterium]